jgi:hypothetical protein
VVANQQMLATETLATTVSLTGITNGTDSPGVVSCELDGEPAFISVRRA